jgi:hypothetical protein
MRERLADVIVLEPAKPSPSSGTLEPPVAVALAGERRLEIEGDGSSFRVWSPSGAAELTVRLTPDGPVLTLSGATIEVVAAKAFKVDVERLELRAKQIRLESTGDVEQIVAGNSVTHCAGRHELQADAVTLVNHGDKMVLDATHDLEVRGERVLINC